jgi:hypothetical protein
VRSIIPRGMTFTVESIRKFNSKIEIILKYDSEDNIQSIEENDGGTKIFCYWPFNVYLSFFIRPNGGELIIAGGQPGCLQQQTSIMLESQEYHAHLPDSTA